MQETKEGEREVCQESLNINETLNLFSTLLHKEQIHSHTQESRRQQPNSIQ